MVNTRSKSKLDDIVTIKGRSKWFDTPRHDRFKRAPEVTDREVRAGTQEVAMTNLTLNFSVPPCSVSASLEKEALF